MNTLKCTRCGEDKQQGEFRFMKNASKYLSVCISCERVSAKEYREKHQEKLNKGHRDYYKNNTDKCKKLSSDWVKNNKEKARLNRKVYMKNNPEKKRQYNDNYREKRLITSSKYRERNRERIRKYARDNYYKYGIKARAYHKLWREQHKGILKIQKETWSKLPRGKFTIRLFNNKRMAQKKGTCDGTITKVSVLRLMENQGSKCNYCKVFLDNSIPRFVHLDHIMPLARGGNHTINNVQFLCQKCNNSKHAKILTKHIN